MAISGAPDGSVSDGGVPDRGARLRTRPGVILAPAGDGRWQARWDFDAVTFLEGTACEEVLPWLAPRLDGSLTYAEILDAGGTHFSRAVLARVIQQLMQGELLEIVTARERNERLRAELADLTGDAGGALERAAAADVIICGSGPLAGRLQRNFSEHGFRSVSVAESWESVSGRCDPEGGGTDRAPLFPVVVTTDWLPQQLESLNDWALAARRRWLVLGVWNSRALIGPTFVPGDTACYRCFHDRLSSHRRHLRAYREMDRWLRAREAPVFQPALPAVQEVSAGLACREVFAAVTYVLQPRTLGRVLVFQPEEASLQTETVLRVPWCPACAGVRAGAHPREDA